MDRDKNGGDVGSDIPEVIKVPLAKFKGIPAVEMAAIRKNLENGDSMGLPPEQEKVIRMMFGIGLNGDVSPELEVREGALELERQILAALAEGAKKEDEASSVTDEE